MPNHAKHMDNVIEAMSIKYNNRVYGMKQEGHDVITLSYGEAYFSVPLFPFDDLPFPSLYHYSHSRGLAPLRKKLCGYYNDRYGVPCNPDTEMVVTAGSKIAIYMALLALVDPGDEVIVHEPTWVSYTEQLKLMQGKPVLAPCTAKIQDLGKYVTPKTRAIIICNPNNPSGHVTTEQEMLYLHNLAKEKNLYLLFDEAYSDYFLPGDKFISGGFHDPKKEHTIICNSMSKNFGISGWRLGYVITNGTLLDQILKLNQHLMTCPATVLEMYLDKHFDEIISITESQIKDVVQKREQVKAKMDSMGLKYMQGNATFYLFVSTAPSALGSLEFADRLLAEQKVSTVAGIGYGQSCDKFVRISVGNEPLERIYKGLEKIRQLIDSTATTKDTVQVTTGSFAAGSLNR